MNLVFATANMNKAREIQHLVGEGWTILTLPDIGCRDEIEETGATLEENAEIKSRFVYTKYQQNCFADDTGLIIDALNGEPGVKSARYAGEEKDAEMNMDLVQARMEGITNRKASFVTIISLVIGGVFFRFEGKLEGSIALARRGNMGFGYDPIFIPVNQPGGAGKTLAELSMAEKNQISHRAIAFGKLSRFLKEKVL